MLSFWRVGNEVVGARVAIEELLRAHKASVEWLKNREREVIVDLLTDRKCDSPEELPLSWL